MSAKSKILSGLLIVATLLFEYLIIKYEWMILIPIYGAIFIIFMVYAPFDRVKAKQPDTESKCNKQNVNRSFLEECGMKYAKALGIEPEPGLPFDTSKLIAKDYAIHVEHYLSLNCG